MKTTKIWIVALLAIFFAFSAAAQDAPATKEAPRDYRLAAGDLIRVLVFQNPEMTLDTRVSENGSITYPLIGSVEIGGLPIASAEQKIATALKTGGFVQEPQVNIVLVEIRGNQVSVLGQVNHPGRFPLQTFNTRVSDMLAAAGGTMPTGDDIAIVTGTRDGKPFRKEIDIPDLYIGGKPDNDIVVSGNDTIYVNRAPVFYIYGEIQHPGPYRIERDMTVMQALAQGGGLTPRGTQSRLRLHRKDGSGKTEEISPELNDLVRANDVIFVRESLF